MNWLITGGAGFIGTNLAEYLVYAGHRVTVVDDLSRDGVRLNEAYLKNHLKLEVSVVDVAERRAFWDFLSLQPDFDAIAHLAGQVSLVESLKDPMRDFQVNALGTLNVLEFVRLRSPGTAVIGMSSNKVYGDLSHVRFTEGPLRYAASEWPKGFDESLPLDFHGPYGCSKGVADQYLADYGRSFGLRTISLRQSSVYGPHQHPRSDQGWVGFIIREACAGRSIRLSGAGKQVRDLLHVHDLARLIELLAARADLRQGHQFNVGGGPDNALSILELFNWLEARNGVKVHYSVGEMRPSDQKVFVADTSRVKLATGWEPVIGLDEGLEEVVRGTASEPTGR